MNVLELYGYLGSALIAISLMMGDIRKLRWINLVGAGTFASYGLLIGSWPVAVLNGFIVLIDVVHLWHLHRRPAPLSDAEFQAGDDYVRNVLAQTLPRIDALDAEQRIRVTFRGTEPVNYELLDGLNETPQDHNHDIDPPLAA